jgi:hypothetical protein
VVTPNPANGFTQIRPTESAVENVAAGFKNEFIGDELPCLPFVYIDGLTPC